MATAWTFVAEVASESDPGKTYRVKRRDADGHLGCDCTAYRFAKGTAKTCKHIEAIRLADQVGVIAWRETIKSVTLRLRQAPVGQNDRLFLAEELEGALSSAGVVVPVADPATKVQASGETFTIRRAISFGPIGG